MIQITSGLRNLLAALFTLGLATPAAAIESSQKVFAGYAGRHYAEKEHAWLMSTANAEVFEDHQRAFLSLLGAVMRPSESSKILGYRIESKMAHASLLKATTFDLCPARKSSKNRCACLQIELWEDAYKHWITTKPYSNAK